ncbi:MAG TPA: ABC transporter substrate-binding protein [Stellaceae bacterium]|nr:ABC transporter substrate-binding protein [Stellaceae bacterium]
MRRRYFIVLAGGAAVAASPALRGAAAQGSRPARVGFISGVDQPAAADFVAALREGLQSFGYVEPGTLRVDAAFADYDLARIPALVKAMEQEGVGVIVTHAAAAPIVVKSERSAPAVYEFSADPVSIGLAADLAHPLFNATGITLMRSELWGKRLELLHEIAPDIHRIAVIANPLHGGEHLERADLAAKANLLGIAVSFFSTPNRAELDRALTAIAADPPQAIAAFSESFVVDNRAYIVNFAMSRRIPVVAGWSVLATAGSLFTYGPRLADSYRRTAYFVDRILKGAKPAELPIEQPTVLELVVNLGSAKILGIDIPPALLARADTVIE